MATIGRINEERRRDAVIKNAIMFALWADGVKSLKMIVYL